MLIVTFFIVALFVWLLLNNHVFAVVGSAYRKALALSGLFDRRHWDS